MLVRLGQTYAEIKIGQRISAFLLCGKRIADSRIGQTQIVVRAGEVEACSVGPLPSPIMLADFNVEVVRFDNHQGATQRRGLSLVYAVIAAWPFRVILVDPQRRWLVAQ